MKDPKERLIESGSLLFSEKWFKGASIREICKEANTGINMIHHYFGNKQGLYESILEKFSAEVFTNTLRIIKKEPDTYQEFVSRFWLFVEETLEALIRQKTSYIVVSREHVIPEAFLEYTDWFIAFISASKKKWFVREELDAEMLTGLIIDRLGNQVLHSDWLKKGMGFNIITNAEYKQRWLQGNIDLFLHGMLTK